MMDCSKKQSYWRVFTMAVRVSFYLFTNSQGKRMSVNRQNVFTAFSCEKLFYFFLNLPGWFNYQCLPWEDVVRVHSHGQSPSAFKMSCWDEHLLFLDLMGDQSFVKSQSWVCRRQGFDLCLKWMVGVFDTGLQFQHHFSKQTQRCWGICTKWAALLQDFFLGCQTNFAI